MRRVVGFTIGVLAGLGATAGPAWANEAPQQDDWACVYSVEADVGHCQANPIPTLDAPPDARVLPEVPELAPLVEEHVVPLIPAARF